MKSSSSTSPAPTVRGAITVRVNGTPREFLGVATAADLLRELDVDARMVVVELNRVIVRRDALSTATVNDGDQVELVHFVGGG